MKLEPTFKELAEKDSNCKGRVYRYREIMYRSKEGLLCLKHEYRLLKRKSCSGCDKCGWIEDFLDEDVGCGIFPSHNPEIKDGDLCTLVVWEEYKDWETGIVDGVDLAFTLCKEESKK